MHKLKWVNIAVAILIEIALLLVVFTAGKTVGFREAGFVRGWGNNYHKFFEESPHGFVSAMGTGSPFGGSGRSAAMRAFGNTGIVLGVHDGTVAIKGEDNMEKTIVVDERTTIVNRQQEIRVGGIKTGDQIIVFGPPTDNGQIHAKFIRVFDTNN